MITIFELVRHGNTGVIDPDQPQVAVRQRWDTPLDEIGNLQAERCGMALSVLRPNVLISSLYKRAEDTAEKINEYLNLSHNRDKRLNELTRKVDGHPFFGDLALAYRRWRGKMLEAADIHGKYADTDQSLFEKLEEVVALMIKLTIECSGQKIVLVTHSQVIALFLAYIDMTNAKDVSPKAFVESFNNRFTKNGSITTVQYDDQKKKWTIVRFNDIRHLF